MRASRILACVVLLLLGAASGAFGTFYYLEVYSPAATVLYKVARPLHLQNGIVVPAGTELMHRWSAPEGFEQLCLGIDVGGEQLGDVVRHVEPKQALFVPYWAVPSTE